MTCPECSHPWAIHLRGVDVLVCSERKCYCQVPPQAYGRTECAVCGAPALERDTLCREHRDQRTSFVRSRYAGQVRSAARRRPRLVRPRRPEPRPGRGRSGGAAEA